MCQRMHWYGIFQIFGVLGLKVSMKLFGSYILACICEMDDSSFHWNISIRKFSFPSAWPITGFLSLIQKHIAYSSWIINSWKYILFPWAIHGFAEITKALSQCEMVWQCVIVLNCVKSFHFCNSTLQTSYLGSMMIHAGCSKEKKWLNLESNLIPHSTSYYLVNVRSQ